jgi:DNA polymerase III alpha subunit (gram-positive type)
MNMCALRCVTTVLGLLLFSAGQAQVSSWPAGNPDQWLLAFVDVETTGLTPGYHEMIDIGIVMTDLAGNEKGELFLRIQPQFPERTQDGARAVNAFDETRWQELGALSPAHAVRSIREFHTGIAGDRSVMMVAFNSHFDAAFIDHLFRTGGGDWRDLYHYFILDLPSMAWSLGLRGLTGQSLSAGLNVEDEPHVAEQHTGITGAQLNARIYRALLEHAPRKH